MCGRQSSDRARRELQALRLSTFRRLLDMESRLSKWVAAVVSALGDSVDNTYNHLAPVHVYAEQPRLHYHA